MPRKPAAKNAPTKVTVRTDTRTVARFDRWCKSLGVSREAGMREVLANPPGRKRGPKPEKDTGPQD